MKKVTNKNLQDAKRKKNDEFYTRYEDIEKEITNYKEYLKGKWIYSPCDDFRWSEFKTYFKNNFEELGLKHYTCTCLNIGNGAWRYDFDGKTETLTQLEGNGDFRSKECLDILDECDIVVTNPPFSLFRDFLAWILAAEKQFLIIGSQNAFTYKEVFPLIRDDKIWMGYNMVKEFYQPDGSIKKFGNICWFTNLPSMKRNEELVLVKKYNSIDYPKYDDYDAIEVSKVANIPMDYEGIMGVPITFLYKYNPNQFEIVGLMATTAVTDINFGYPYVNGKKKFARVLIRRKK